MALVKKDFAQPLYAAFTAQMCCSAHQCQLVVVQQIIEVSLA